ncbi:hypothetical protein GW17_00031236, partial [Ensete ventricosum]
PPIHLCIGSDDWCHISSNGVRSEPSSSMASSLTAPALRFWYLRPLLALERGSATSLQVPSRIRCGLRGERKPLWRGRVMSTEAIQAVQALKHANASSSSRRIEDVLDARVGRLLKADQIAVLAELQRQNELQLALQVFVRCFNSLKSFSLWTTSDPSGLQVFAFIRKEVWYKPELSLYSDMIFMLGKNKLIGLAEELFSELQKEGLQPDTRAYTEMIGAFLQVDMVEKAMDVYKSMKELGCSPDKLTLTILIRNLEKVGLEDLASDVRKDCAEYMDFPEKFLKEVDKKFVSTCSLDLQ